MNKFAKIRTGVIGVGSMGQNHARVYSEISNLVGVADPNKEQGIAISERLGVKWYSNYEELLSEVDAVTIAAPTFLHKKIAKIVAEAGVNMLVEKPLAGNSSDAQDIITTASRNNVVLAVGHIERHNAIVQRARECVEQGEWGEIISLSASRFSNYPSRIRDVGVLFDLTIHDVDVLCFLANSKVNSIHAVGGHFKNQKYEDYVSLSLRYDDGKVGLCQTNWLTPMKVRELNILTTTGFVNLNYLNQEIHHLSSTYNTIDESNLYKTGMEVAKSKIKLKGEEPLKNELIDFLNSIVKKTNPLVSGEEGLMAVRIVEAGLKSLKENKVIKIK